MESVGNLPIIGIDALGNTEVREREIHACRRLLRDKIRSPSQDQRIEPY